MILIGVLIFLSFPFIVLQKIKKNETRKYRRGKEKIKFISYLYDARSSNSYCTYFTWS